MLATMEAATRTLIVPINLEMSPVHATTITSATDLPASVSDLRSVFTSTSISL